MDKLERAKLRVDRSIQLREEKTLLDCKNEVITIRHNFEEAHNMYVAKTRRTDITDAGQRDLFNKFNDSDQDALDSILALLSKNKEEMEALLKNTKEYIPDAYIKSSNVYLGCIH